MTESNLWYQGLNPKPRDEAGYIVREFAARGIEIVGVRSDDGGVAYMYAPDQVLAREQYLEGIGQPGWAPSQVQTVLNILRENGAIDAHVVRRVARDIVLISLSAAAPGNGGPRTEHPDLPALLDRVEEALGAGIATPNHVLTVANGPFGEMSPCPATEPQEVYGPPRPYPGVCLEGGGARVRIYIADTGLLANAADNFSWLSGVTGDLDPRSGPGGEIGPYDGHGTFGAGVVRCMAPEADIFVANVFNIAGSALESDIGSRLNGAFDYDADIIQLTIASPSRNNVPMLGLEAWLDQLDSHKGVVCLAAAGNNGSSIPCWPGAFPRVISVGALAADWRSRAYFSNFGRCVDVYAPGQNLVNAFASGSYTCAVAPYANERRTFSGMAQWSGTSFSTPIVTGLVASRMSRTAESGRQAAAALLTEAETRAIPGTGPVLLPHCRPHACQVSGCPCEVPRLPQ